MLRHSAVLYRDDAAAATAVQPPFTGDAWESYVPIRMPDTVAVEENLPAGAAAVLINRNHTFTDIYLPLAAQEKRLFDAIDGTRTIRDIAGADEALDVSRALFERLYWYDQIAFEAPARTPLSAPH